MRGRVVNRIGLGTAAVCLAVGGLALAGCGGGSTSTTTVTATTGSGSGSGSAGSKPLSQSEFTSKANAVCSESNDKIKALKALPANPTLNDLANLAAQQVMIAEQTYSQLAAITPPSDLQHQYSQYLAKGRATIGVARQLETAATSGDTGQLKKLAQKLAVNNKQGDNEATALGLDECAKDVHPQG